MAKVMVNGVEYVPRAEIPELTDERLKACLRELICIQYFPADIHKHRAWAWDAINKIAPELAELVSQDPEAAWERVSPTD